MLSESQRWRWTCHGELVTNCSRIRVSDDTRPQRGITTTHKLWLNTRGEDMALSGFNRSLRRLFGQIQPCRVATSHTARALNQAAPQPEPSADENQAVNPTFVNRNPRNLEQMALAVKDRGWSTSWPQREFYHRLVFSRSQHHVTAQVFSSSSPVPVLTCSTTEWSLRKELASTRCVAACQAVGEVLAQRCQQAGITRMVYRAIPWTYRSDAVQAFRAAMKEGGVTLSEPRRKYIGT